ncbi:hypothetical protein ACWC9T_38305 [Kitasatospora sp. NPDC001159]
MKTSARAVARSGQIRVPSPDQVRDEHRLAGLAGQATAPTTGDTVMPRGA